MCGSGLLPVRVLEVVLLPLDQQLDDEAVWLVHSVVGELVLGEAVQLVHSVVEDFVETIVGGFRLISDELLVSECYPINLASSGSISLRFLLTKVIVRPAFESVEVPSRRLSISCLCLWNC